MIPDHHYMHERRHPTTAELGLDVTVGIAANTVPDGYIVAASDQQISYDDLFPALERGVRKIIQIGPDKSWFCAFSASDISVVPPLLATIMEDIKQISPQGRLAKPVMEAVANAYSAVRNGEFARRHLRAIGYDSVEQFRKEGFANLGKDEHQKHMNALYEYNLGVELLIFGHTERSRSHIFTVNNPGKFTHWNWQGYAAIGSGSYLATGSLRQRPLRFDIEDAIYRLLEAKFVAEGSGSGTVGTTTTLLTLSPAGQSWEMRESEIEQIRETWKRKQQEPTPEDALGVIRKTSVLRHLSRDGER